MSGKDTVPGHFGLLIVYVIPGFTALQGLPSPSAPLLAKDLLGAATDASLAGFLYGTVAAITAGLIVSAVRWLVLDTLHHRSGLRRPPLDFAALERNVAAFEFLVQNHYWYYKFYANMVVALAWACATAADKRGARGWVYGLLIALFLLASRDALKRYYERVGGLLAPRAEPTPAASPGYI